MVLKNYMYLKKKYIKKKKKNNSRISQERAESIYILKYKTVWWLYLKE